MPTRGRGNRITKSRRGGRKPEIILGSAEEHAALFAQHSNGTVNFLRPRPSNQDDYSNGNHGNNSGHGHNEHSPLESTLHFPTPDILHNSHSSSNKQLSFYSDVDAEADEAFVLVNPLTGMPRTAEELVLDTYGDIIKIDSALCRKLASQVAIRPPSQRRTAQKLNMERRSNVEALLAQVTGEPPARSCKSCYKGHGPWTECIVYDGQMCGSCANCWFNASGSRCTFHAKSDSSQLLPPGEPPTPPTQTQAAALPPHPQPAPPPPSSLPYPGTPALPDMPPVSLLQNHCADSYGVTAPTRLLVSQAMGNATSLSRRDRLLARIEAAAEELGLRIAEYNEYLHTPEGIMEQQRFEDEEDERNIQRMQAHGHVHEPPSVDSGSIDDGGM